MLKRLFLGLLIGVVLGAVVAAGLVEGLGVLTFGSALLAYVAAAVTGVVVGLVAGKPIWAKGAQIEAGLKAFFGALLGAGAMFAVRQWLKMDVDLSMIHPGMVGQIGNVPAAALPLIAAVLGGFYELDNTAGSDADADQGRQAGKGGKRVAAGKVRVGHDEEVEDDDGAEPTASASKKTKR